MILNENLVKTVMLTKEKSENAYNTILQMFNATPSGNWENQIFNNSLSLETYGNLNGEFGVWSISARLDNTQKIEDISIMFSGEKSSRKPYADKYVLTLSKPSTPTSRKRNLVSLIQTRTYNYRFLAPEKNNLTAHDVAKLSKPEVISSFSLNISKDFRGKTTVSSSEKIGKFGNATECTTLNKEFEEIQA